MVDTATGDTDIIIGNSCAALFTFKTAYKATKRDKQEKPSNPKEDESKNNSSSKIAWWGANNLFPQELIKNIEKSTILRPSIDLKARMLHAGGLEYGYYDEKGKFERIYDKEIEGFISNSNLKRYYLNLSTLHHYTFTAIFPKLFLSKDRKKIVFITSLDPTFCRLEKQNNRGEIKNLYFSANWELNDAKYKKTPFLDIWGDTVQLLKESKHHSVIYPLIQPDIGKSYYPSPIWYTAITSKWFDVSLNIPLFKKALMENQMTIKYLIEVPEYFWSDKYDNWKKFKPEEKQAKQKEFLDSIESSLSDNLNAGRTILSTFRWREHIKDIIPSIKITAIDNKIKDGIYIEDGEAANAYILYSLGVPAALLGNKLGKSQQGSGSGSDVRELFNLYRSNVKPHEETILEPLKFIAQYNGWNDRLKNIIEFRFKMPMMQTLDNISPDKRETKPSE